MLKRLILILVALIVVAAGLSAYLVFGEVEIPAPGTATVIVKKGAHMGQIADELDRQGLIYSKTVFRWLGRLAKVDRRIKPGRYDFQDRVSIYHILQDLYHQNAVVVRVVFPEGWRIDQFAWLLEGRVGVPAERIVELSRDSALLARWEIPDTNAQGYLMPAAYQFYWGAEPEEIIEELISATRSMFIDSLKTRMAELGWNEHQVLTMASLIEAEAGVAEERSRISSVFHNRLRKGYRLQCDPTVIYALGGIDRALTYKDLEINSPYNTYLHYGLPPGPIGNPGRPAVMAALYPLDSDELYFVARGDGTHIFSKTLAEHNRARRQVKRLQRGGG
jgi:UPF0755 protein